MTTSLSSVPSKKGETELKSLRICLPWSHHLVRDGAKDLRLRPVLLVVHSKHLAWKINFEESKTDRSTHFTLYLKSFLRAHLTQIVIHYTFVPHYRNTTASAHCRFSTGMTWTGTRIQELKMLKHIQGRTNSIKCENMVALICLLRPLARTAQKPIPHGGWYCHITLKLGRNCGNSGFKAISWQEVRQPKKLSI